MCAPHPENWCLLLLSLNDLIHDIARRVIWMITSLHGAQFTIWTHPSFPVTEQHTTIMHIISYKGRGRYSKNFIHYSKRLLYRIVILWFCAIMITSTTKHLWNWISCLRPNEPCAVIAGPSVTTKKKLDTIHAGSVSQKILLLSTLLSAYITVKWSSYVRPWFSGRCSVSWKSWSYMLYFPFLMARLPLPYLTTSLHLIVFNLQPNCPTFKFWWVRLH
jgi:hypothetical protein